MIPQLPLRGSGRTPEQELPDQDYWLSYSDLLAGLLMVFTLMLLAALYTYQSGVDGVREILAVRQELVETLRAEFQEGETRVVEIQPDGTVRFSDDVGFLEDSVSLEPEVDSVVRAFAGQYLDVLFGDARFEGFRSELEAIVVEGHTNDNGGYKYNLSLSQRRAYTVMEVMLDEAREEYEADLQRLITANGRSFAELVCLNGEVDLESSTAPDTTLRCAGRGGVDLKKSRRIEIRFQLKDRELLEQLLALLDNQ